MKPTVNMLILSVAIVLSINASAEDWPQWRGTERDGVWRESGIIDSFASDTIPVKWSVPVGAGYNGPTVADGRVYVMDRVTEPAELERIHCFAADSGEALWTHEYSAPYRIDYPLGPRASVTIQDGRAFAFGAMGHFHCLDAESGEVLWSHDLAPEYEIDIPIWGLSCSPLVYGGLVIVQIGGADGACVVAFDVENGEEVWRAIDDKASYSSPILIQQNGEDIVVMWTGSFVNGMKPLTGEVVWSHEFKPTKMIHNIATPVLNECRLFFTAFFDGSLMLKPASDSFEVEELWQRRGKNERNPEALHATITTPIVDGDYIYGMDSYGEFRCIDAANGDRIWTDQTVLPHGRWATVHLVRQADRVWIFNELGELMIASLSPDGIEIHDRAQLIEPTTYLPNRGRNIAWSHPAFANGHIFARSDAELICADLSAD